jgi:hypothetical protein
MKIKGNGTNGNKYLIFDHLKMNATAMTHVGVQIIGDQGHIRFSNCEIWGSPDNLFLIGRFSNFNEIIGCTIHDNIETPNVGTRPDGHGVYIGSSNNLIERNVLHHITGYGVHMYNGYKDGTRASNNIIRYNIGHHNSTVADASAAFLIGSGDNNLAYGNVAYDNPVGIMVGQNGATNSKVYNNTVYNNRDDGIQVRLQGSSNSGVIKNNIAYGNNTSGAGANIHDYSTSGHTFSNNLCSTTGGTTDCALTTSSAVFANAPSADFSLIAGSAAINAGVAISGFTYNGSAPDIGAHETFTCASAQVPAAAPNTLILTCSNNVSAFTPLLPATGCHAGFTVLKAGANDTVTGCTCTGTNELTLQLQNAIVAGNTVTVAYNTATGAITNSALLGGTANQRLLSFSAFSAANNVADEKE